jgi:hypothetical protein
MAQTVDLRLNATSGIERPDRGRVSPHRKHSSRIDTRAEPVVCGEPVTINIESGVRREWP